MNMNMNMIVINL